MSTTRTTHVITSSSRSINNSKRNDKIKKRSGSTTTTTTTTTSSTRKPLQTTKSYYNNKFNIIKRRFSHKAKPKNLTKEIYKYCSISQEATNYNLSITELAKELLLKMQNSDFSRDQSTELRDSLPIIKHGLETFLKNNAMGLEKTITTTAINLSQKSSESLKVIDIDTNISSFQAVKSEINMNEYQFPSIAGTEQNNDDKNVTKIYVHTKESNSAAHQPSKYNLSVTELAKELLNKMQSSEILLNQSSNLKTSIPMIKNGLESFLKYSANRPELISQNVLTSSRELNQPTSESSKLIKIDKNFSSYGTIKPDLNQQLIIKSEQSEQHHESIHDELKNEFQNNCIKELYVQHSFNQTEHIHNVPNNSEDEVSISSNDSSDSNESEESTKSITENIRIKAGKSDFKIIDKSKLKRNPFNSIRKSSGCNNNPVDRSYILWNEKSCDCEKCLCPNQSKMKKKAKSNLGEIYRDLQHYQEDDSDENQKNIPRKKQSQSSLDISTQTECDEDEDNSDKECEVINFDSHMIDISSQTTNFPDKVECIQFLQLLDDCTKNNKNYKKSNEKDTNKNNHSNNFNGNQKRSTTSKNNIIAKPTLHKSSKRNSGMKPTLCLPLQKLTEEFEKISGITGVPVLPQNLSLCMCIKDMEPINPQENNEDKQYLNETNQTSLPGEKQNTIINDRPSQNYNNMDDICYCGCSCNSSLEKIDPKNIYKRYVKTKIDNEYCCPRCQLCFSITNPGEENKLDEKKDNQENENDDQQTTQSFEQQSNEEFDQSQDGNNEEYADQQSVEDVYEESGENIYQEFSENAYQHSFEEGNQQYIENKESQSSENVYKPSIRNVQQQSEESVDYQSVKQPVEENEINIKESVKRQQSEERDVLDNIGQDDNNDVPKQKPENLRSSLNSNNKNNTRNGSVLQNRKSSNSDTQQKPTNERSSGQASGNQKVETTKKVKKSNKLKKKSSKSKNAESKANKFQQADETKEEQEQQSKMKEKKIDNAAFLKKAINEILETSDSSFSYDTKIGLICFYLNREMEFEKVKRDIKNSKYCCRCSSAPSYSKAPTNKTIVDKDDDRDHEDNDYESDDCTKKSKKKNKIKSDDSNENPIKRHDKNPNLNNNNKNPNQTSNDDINECDEKYVSKKKGIKQEEDSDNRSVANKSNKSKKPNNDDSKIKKRSEKELLNSNEGHKKPKKRIKEDIDGLDQKYSKKNLKKRDSNNKISQKKYKKIPKRKCKNVADDYEDDDDEDDEDIILIEPDDDDDCDQDDDDDDGDDDSEECIDYDSVQYQLYKMSCDCDCKNPRKCYEKQKSKAKPNCKAGRSVIVLKFVDPSSCISNSAKPKTRTSKCK